MFLPYNLSLLPGSNRRPTDYKSVALPAELRRPQGLFFPIRQRTPFFFTAANVLCFGVLKKRFNLFLEDWICGAGGFRTRVQLGKS